MIPSEKPVILIIEDTIEFARLTQMMLKRFGYDSHHAEDGEAAVAFCEGQRPDVVLMDLNLPGLSGHEALGLLRAGESTRDIPVIAVTASAMDAERSRALAAGFFRYITKPIDVEQLNAAIDEGLALRRGKG